MNSLFHSCDIQINYTLLNINYYTFLINSNIKACIHISPNTLLKYINNIINNDNKQLQRILKKGKSYIKNMHLHILCDQTNQLCDHTCSMTAIKDYNKNAAYYCVQHLIYLYHNYPLLPCINISHDELCKLNIILQSKDIIIPTEYTYLRRIITAYTVFYEINQNEINQNEIQ